MSDWFSRECARLDQELRPVLRKLVQETTHISVVRSEMGSFRKQFSKLVIYGPEVQDSKLVVTVWFGKGMDKKESQIYTTLPPDWLHKKSMW